MPLRLSRDKCGAEEIRPGNIVLDQRRGRAAGGGFSGLFQFLPATYCMYPRLPGEAHSYWPASGSADVAAWMFAYGRDNQWPCA